jgi:hypothetical protein
MKSEFDRLIFEKYSNVIFHGNPSSGTKIVPCGRTGMTKLIVAFRKFANTPRNGILMTIHFWDTRNYYSQMQPSATIPRHLKTFDKVWATGPIAKLTKAKLSTHLIYIIHKYLPCRVLYKWKFVFKPKPFQARVPQDSLLGTTSLKFVLITFRQLK